MKKAAIIIANGFEEGETLTIIDIIRRANLVCDIFSTEGEMVEGSHNISVKADKILDESVEEYDMVILPGGLPGATNLRDNDKLMEILKNMNNNGKYVCAMCAAPIALERAGCLDDKNYTAYLGYDEKIKSGNYLAEKVVVDGNVVTSRGPATAYAFAYKLVDLLGGDSLAVKHRMVYFNAFDVKEDE